MLPSQRVDRMEFIDSEAWDELCFYAQDELEGSTPGLAYLRRIQKGVRRSERDGAIEHYILTTYEIPDAPMRHATISAALCSQEEKVGYELS
eukprot:2351706-Pleurochrysis_carterae.AAC.2